MFYSQCLLSKKGPLGTIWVAAHCFKRVKKNQVTQTNISSSVDKILLDEVPVVTYRVLGYLLLGVVRIFSKKVEYLFHDCRHVLVKINDFVGNKKSNVHIEALCAPHLSITRPDRFELDAFDLQILEDGSSVHLRPDEDIILEDAWKNEDNGQCSSDKYHWEEDASYIQTCSTVYTPVKDVISPHFMENDMVASSSHNLSNLEASIEKLRGNNFSLEERLDPMSPGEVEEEPGLARAFGEKHQNDGDVLSPYFMENDMAASNLEASIENLRANNFSLEERLDTMSIGGDEEKPGLVGPFDEKHQNDGEQIKLPDTGRVIGADGEPPDRVRSFDEEQHMNVEQKKFTEMISPESTKCQITREGCPVSITIDVIHELKFPNASGATTPEFMVVRTPATKERARISRKRKCLFDDIIVLPNKVLKESIDDSRNLVCKRKKAPHSTLHARKAYQLYNLPQSFLEPLIPCISLELRSLFCRKKLKSPEAVETVEAPEKLDILGSPTVQRSPDLTDIAPSTPVAHSTSLRLHEVPEISNVGGVGRASSFQRIERESSSDDKEFDICLINEDINSCEGDNQEMNEWSVRTRTVARYLCKNFLYRKERRGEEAVNLLQVLKEKTKTESARLFYEILVLKSGGYIDVKQHAPYDDILVLETPKLLQSYEVDEG